MISAVFAVAILGAWNWSLTDDQLIARVSNIFSNKEGPREPYLGLHHGTKVVVSVICGDICPAYTVRIIHYDVDPDRGCAAAGGHVATVVVTQGIAAFPRPFCIPEVLYRRQLFTDRPYAGGRN